MRQAGNELDKGRARQEQKRAQTRVRIAQSGLALFLAKGYEATTLDEVAEEAEISRRTFFHYFKSKEDILLAYEAKGFKEALLGEISSIGQELGPLAAAKTAMVKLAFQYETPESIEVDRLLRSSEALRARKQAGYTALELTLSETLTSVWGRRLPKEDARLVAMLIVGLLRLALDCWREPGSKHDLATCIQACFDRLEDASWTHSSLTERS